MYFCANIFFSTENLTAEFDLIVRYVIVQATVVLKR